MKTLCVLLAVIFAVGAVAILINSWMATAAQLGFDAGVLVGLVGGLFMAYEDEKASRGW